LFRHTSIPAGATIATQEVTSKTRHAHHQVVNIIYRKIIKTTETESYERNICTVQVVGAT
jgi:hypothetical protein